MLRATRRRHVAESRASPNPRHCMFMRTIARYQLHNAHSNEPALHHGQDKRTWLLAVPPDHQHARFACRWALKHLVKPGDSLSLVHVAQPALPPGRLFASASGQPALLRSPPRPDPALMVEAARRSGLGEQLLADAAAHPEVRSSFEVLPPAQGSRGKACVASTLCATAQERGAAALVLASSPRGGIIEALHGSVAARLVHDCDVPVVVLHPPSSGAAAAADGASTTADADAAATAAADLGDSSVAWLLRSRPPPSGAQPERRIMLAVDDSDEAAAAVEWVMSHVYRQGDLLHLLHIVPALPPHITSSLAPDGLLYSCPLPLLDEAQVEEAAWRDVLMDRLGPALAARDVPYVLDVLTDFGPDPLSGVASAVVGAAAAVGAAALVLVGHRRDSITEWLLGSVCDFASRRAGVPVIVLHLVGDSNSDGSSNGRQGR